MPCKALKKKTPGMQIKKRKYKIMIEQTLKMFFNRIDNYMFKFTLF